MKIIRSFFALVARFLISLIFLAGALNKILHWHESERTLHATLCEWQFNIGYYDQAHECLSALIPLTPILLLVATLMEFFGALSVLLGVKEKLGATLLVLFLIPASIVMHPFWFMDGGLKDPQLAHFLKNMAIVGGLIVVILQGTESKSFRPNF